MRVLLVSTYSPVAVGGIGQFVHDLSIALHRRGVHVTAIHRFEPPEYPVSNSFAAAARLVEVRPIDVRGLRTMSVNWRTSAWIANHRGEYDVVHGLNPMPMAAAALRSSHRAGIPFLVTIFAKYPRSPRVFLRWVNRRAERALLERSDLVAYESENTMREFRPHAGRVILNGIDTDYYRPRADLRGRLRKSLGIADGEFVILFLGRMDRLKGIYVFLDALAALGTEVPAVSTLLVGSIEVTDLPEVIARLGLTSRVRLVGPVGKLDVLDYYCAADLFVLPSFVEGISSSLIEAMACGLPAVVTAVGGNTEVVRDGVEGLHVPPGDVGALAAALRSMAQSPEMGRGLGTRARARIQEKFSLDQMADGYLAAYRQISREGDAPQADVEPRSPASVSR